MIYGEKNAPILCVMSSPMSEGMEAWFWKRLHEVGVLKTNVHLVTILDEPPGNSGGRMSAKQKINGFENLVNNLKDVTPKAVLALGPDALYMLTGIKEDIFDSRGYLISPELRGTVVTRAQLPYDTYKRDNPKKGIKKGDPKYKWFDIDTQGALPESYKGYVVSTFQLDHIRSESFAIQPAFVHDVDRVQRAAEGKLEIIDDSFVYSTRPDYDYPSGLLAVDIETHGVDNEVIDRISVSDGITSHSIEWTEGTRRWLNRQINDLGERTLIFHNSPFDVPRLRAAGVDISDEMLENETIDTMMLSVLLQPDLHKGLGRVASLYFDTFPWKWERVKSTDEIYYSAKDAFVTARLGKKEIKHATQMKMMPLFTGKDFEWGPGEMAVLPYLTQATKDGLKVDRGRALEWAGKLEVKLLEAQKEWSSLFPLVNPSSNHDVKRLLYGEWKLPIVKTKEEGITVRELALIKCREYIKTEYAKQRDENPWSTDPRCTPEVFDLLLKIRGTGKLLGTYALPVLESDDLYVHPQYLPVSKDAEKSEGSYSKGNTATGRLASSRPNIQNQPKEARILYVPDTPGDCFVQFDYSKAELYAMAYSANDPVMIGDLHSGDPYQRLGDGLEPKVSRPNAKNVLLAGQYLAGANKVSDMILEQQHVYIPPSVCKMVLDGIATRYHVVAGYKRYLVDLCKTRGYIVNPFGRVRIFYDRRAAAAVDFIPQSIVADILWCVLRDVALAARACGGRFVTTVHDSILIQVPADRVEEVIKMVRPLMERTFDCVANGFYIPVSVEVGEPGASWGELKEW